MLSDYRRAEKARLEERLTVAETRVAKSAKHLARQIEITEFLENKGFSQSAVIARQLLSLFMEVTAFHTADRDKLVKSLAELK